MFFPIRDDNPTRGTPWVTHGLIALNVAVFVVVSMGESVGRYWLTAWYGLVPTRLLADPFGEVVTVLTSMFMHGGVMHLASNMWFLHIFGDNLEDVLGRARYVAFYLLAGVAAAAAQVFTNTGSSLPMVGASGAIAGVMNCAGNGAGVFGPMTAGFLVSATGNWALPFLVAAGFAVVSFLVFYFLVFPEPLREKISLSKTITREVRA